jgi:hypothetical protein
MKLDAPLLLVACLALAACVPAPKKAYAPPEAETLKDMDEVMRVNAAYMDPLFARSDETKVEEATWGEMERAGTMMQSTGKALKQNDLASPYPAGFLTFAEALRAEGEKLSAAAKGRDAAEAQSAVRSIQNTCRSCHNQYR